MRIAQVAPLFERVPPAAYGGTERVIASLTEELVRQGHQVTLFASGDSCSTAELVAPVRRAARAQACGHGWLASASIQMDQVAALADSFDVLHFHTDFLHFPLAHRLGWPHVTTLHGRLDLAEVGPLLTHFADMPLVSVSNHQRLPAPQANWVATVYHGVPTPAHEFASEGAGYFAFVGRVSPEKRLDRAIAIASHAGKPLRIAAKVDNADRAYFEHDIRPLLADGNAHFLGELDEGQKRQLLRHADALLFPIDWPEPFGLVMIEALSCGTPVLAFRAGSVPEVIVDGLTGIVVDSLEEACAAAARIGMLDRRACRADYEKRFTAERMALDYVSAYETIAAHGSRRPW